MYHVFVAYHKVNSDGVYMCFVFVPRALPAGVIIQNITCSHVMHSKNFQLVEKSKQTYTLVCVCMFVNKKSAHGQTYRLILFQHYIRWPLEIAVLEVTHY